MQVSKNTAADFHRRRLLILCAVASCRSIALDSSETFTPAAFRIFEALDGGKLVKKMAGPFP
jgi:hypothetical protein